MIIGQKIICNKIDNSTLDTFPRTLMLIGAQGAGKHLICSYIADKFNLMQLDITDEISLELIDEISQRVEPYLYLIRVNEISVKEQNIILKFLEEPLANSFIVLLAEATGDILDTVMNRCQKWYLQNYDREFLKTFTDNEDVLKICTTPGQIKALIDSDFTEMITLANKIVQKIGAANLPNVMTIPSKLGFKNERGKIDPKLFIQILVSSFRDEWLKNNNKNLIDAYKLTEKLSADSRIKNIDLKYLFDKYLIEVREIMRRS